MFVFDTRWLWTSKAKVQSYVIRYFFVCMVTSWHQQHSTVKQKWIESIAPCLKFSFTFNCPPLTMTGLLTKSRLSSLEERLLRLFASVMSDKSWKLCMIHIVHIVCDKHTSVRKTLTYKFIWNYHLQTYKITNLENMRQFDLGILKNWKLFSFSFLICSGCFPNPSNSGSLGSSQLLSKNCVCWQFSGNSGVTW